MAVIAIHTLTQRDLYLLSCLLEVKIQYLNGYEQVHYLKQEYICTLAFLSVSYIY